MWPFKKEKMKASWYSIKDMDVFVLEDGRIINKIYHPASSYETYRTHLGCSECEFLDIESARKYVEKYYE